MACTLIRPFGLRNCLRLQSLARRSAPLQLERHLTRPQSPLWAAIGAPLPWHGTGAATYLYFPDNKAAPLSGFVQAIKRLGRPEADVTCIAPAHDAHERAPEVWLELLTHIAYAAAEHGLQRLHLCLDSDSPALATVTSAGYVPYIQETLFFMKQAPPADQSLKEQKEAQEAELHVRSQREADSFGLQRLQNRYTPPLVQQAEGTLVNQDEPPSPLDLRTWWQPEQTEGFVYEQRAEIVSAAQLRRGSSGHWLRLLGDPSATTAASALLAMSLQALQYYSPRPIYCALRPYQSSLGPLLRQAGFEPGPVLTRLVKYTTRFAKKPIVNAAQEFAEVPLPGRGLLPTE